jgi:endonuclease G
LESAFERLPFAALAEEVAGLESTASNFVEGLEARVLPTVAYSNYVTTAARADSLPQPSPRLQPMTVRLRDSAPWSGPEGFELGCQVGNIVTGMGTRESLHAVARDARVISVDASRPAGTFDCVRSVPRVKADLVHQPPLEEKGDKAIVGLIDSGIDVLHQAFLDGDGLCRIVEIWDQHDPSGPTPAKVYPGEDLPSHGTLHTADKISRYVANLEVPGELGRDISHGGHGTHVASIAAGRKVGKFGGGVAPAARLLVVKPKLDASLGYSNSHINALKYLRRRAEMLNLPIVINVSQGMNAGAHDGSSYVEAAFDGISENGRLPGLVVVKSAGNECNLDGHASFMLGTGQKVNLDWISQDPLRRREDYIELWFKSCDLLDLALVDPSAQASAVASSKQPHVKGRFAGGEEYVLEYTRFHPDNGDSRVKVVITPAPNGQIRGGVWMLRISGAKILSNGEVHAWFERSLTRPTRFITHRNNSLTISIPGTAESVITVGAVDLDGFNTQNSSFGLTRNRPAREKPDVVAPGHAILAAQAGTPTGDIAMEGTSMAAPHVTGAIALALSHFRKRGGNIPNAVQIKAALVQTTEGFGGFHNNSTGYGLLNTKAFFDTLEQYFV